MQPANPELFTLLRLNREYDRYTKQAGSVKNRIIDLIRFAVPCLQRALPVSLFHSGTRELLRDYL